MFLIYFINTIKYILEKIIKNLCTGQIIIINIDKKLFLFTSYRNNQSALISCSVPSCSCVEYVLSCSGIVNSWSGIVISISSSGYGPSCSWAVTSSSWSGYVSSSSCSGNLIYCSLRNLVLACAIATKAKRTSKIEINNFLFIFTF